jgi:hypothetical protein
LVQPQQGPSDGELVLPGNVSAVYSGSIYGRVSGYVKDWYDWRNLDLLLAFCAIGNAVDAKTDRGDGCNDAD